MNRNQVITYRVFLNKKNEILKMKCKNRAFLVEIMVIVSDLNGFLFGSLILNRLLLQSEILTKKIRLNWIYQK
jgi:hypothetical protein